MPTHVRTFGSLLVTASLAAAFSTSLSPAHAMPERFTDAGTVVWCEGEGGTLTAIDTTRAGASWSAGMMVADVFASAGGESALFDGTGLHGSSPAYDDETGTSLGSLTVHGTITRGVTEVLSGWEVDYDGRRKQVEGTRTDLSGAVTLTLGEAAVSLECVGVEFDTTIFQLTSGPASTLESGWSPDSHELGDGAGALSFYGDKEHALGIALDLYSPSYVFGGEQLQVRNGHVDGSLLLRDPETWLVVGIATVSGTVTETGRERIEEIRHGYQDVTEVVHHDVSLTVESQHGEWSGTWPATHETTRTLTVIPPRA